MDVFVLCVVVALLSLHVYAVISGACVARFVVEEGQEQAGKALARAAVALEVLKTALADEGGGGGEEPGGAAGEEEPQAGCLTRPGTRGAPGNGAQRAVGAARDEAAAELAAAAATPDGPADSDGSLDGTSSGSDSDDAPSSFGRQSEIGGDAEESSDTDDTDGQPGAPDLDLDQAERIMLALEDDDRDAEWDGDGAGIGGDAAQAGAFTIDQFLDQFFASQFWLPGVAAAACSPLLIGFCLLLVLLSHAIGFAVGDVAPASPARADLDALRNGTGIGHLACPAQGPMGVGNATAPGSDEWLSLAWKGDRDVRWVAKELWPGVWGSFGAVGITQALMLPVDETAGRALVGLLVVSGLLSAVFSACAVPCLLVRQLRSGLCGRPEALATAADLAVRRAAAKGASGAPVGDDLAQARLAATEAASSLARSSEGRIGQAARLASPASCGIEASFEAGACSCTGICNAVSLAVDPCARSCSGAVALYLVLPIAAGAVAACAAMAEGSALAGLAVAVSPAPLLPGVNGTLAWSSLEPLTAALSSALDLPSSPDVIVSPMADVVWGAWTSEWWLLATRLLLLGTGILAIAEDVASATTSVLVMPSCLTVALSPRAPPATSTSELGFNASTTCRTVIVDLFARFAWACLVTVALLGPSGAVLLDATPERAASVPAAAMAVAPSIATLSVQLPPTWCSPPAEQAGGHEPDGLNASSSHAIASCALSYSWRQAPLDDDVLGLAGLAASPLHFAATALGRGRPPLAFGWPGIDAAPGATVSGITLGANSSQPATSRQASPDPGRFLGTEPGRRLSATALSLSDSGALELPLGTWTWSVPVRGKEVKADQDRCGSARTGPCAPPPPSLQLSGLRKAPTRSASGLVVQSPAWAAFHRASAADVAVRDLHEGLSRDAVQALVDRCGATMVSSTPAGVPALELAVGTSAAAALSGAGSRCGAPAAATSADPGWDASPELVLSDLLSLAGRQGTAAGKLAAQGGAGAAPGQEGPNAAAIEALLDGSQGAFNASGAAHEAVGDDAQEQERQELARVWLHAPAAAFPMPLSSWWPQTRRAVVKMAKSGASIVGAVPSSTDPATAYLVPEPCSSNCTADRDAGRAEHARARPASVRLVLGPLLPRLLLGRRWGLVVDVPAAAMWWQALSLRESGVGDALLCAALLGLVFDATRTALWMVTSRLVSTVALCFPVALRGLVVMQDSLVVVARRRRGKRPGVKPIARIHVWESLRHSPALVRLSGRPALASTGGLAVTLEHPSPGEPRLIAASSQFFADSSLVAQHVASLDGTDADVSARPARAPWADSGGSPAWRHPWAVPAPLSVLPGLARRSARPGSKLSAEATAAGVDWALGRASLPTDQGPASAVWQASLDGRPLEFVVGHDRKHERDADDMFSSDDSSSDSGSDSDSDGGDEPAASEADRAAAVSVRPPRSRQDSARAVVERQWRGAGALWAVARAVRFSVGHEQPIRHGFEHRREWRRADASKTRQELQTCRRLVRAAPGCASGGGEPSDRLARVLATWLRVASVAWEAVPLAATALLVADLALAVAVALVWAGMWAGACLWAESPHLEALLPHGPVVAIVGLLAVCMFLEKFYLAVVTGATVVGSFLLLKGKALLSPLAAAVGWALTSCAVEEHFAMHVGALPMHRGTRTGATTERVLGWCAVTFVGLPALLMAMGSASLVLLNGFEAPYQASSIWAPPALVPTMPGASYYATISSPPRPHDLSVPTTGTDLARAAAFAPPSAFALASLPTWATNSTVASNPAMRGLRPASSLGGHLAILISFMADAAAVLRVGSLHWGIAALAAGLIAMPILERLPGVARSLWMVMDLMTLHSWPSESKEYFKAVAGACLTSVVALGLTTLPSLFRRVSHYAMLVALGTGSSTWHLALPRWVLDGMARWLGASLDPFTGAATGHWAAAAAAGWADHGGVVFPWWPAPAVVESAAFAVVSALVVAECGCGSVSRLCCPRRERLRVRSRQPRA
ncbi:hypothetical protein FNF29_01368 [Cafeteria roenbergensis]|uniref:Uncharacterized protein n=1 Tax=Cafeteria roenbergensis TaxID=33653 RepID=A0A5A8CTC0_CAFRO|nr:hypothetical protein FNF29_01368 [Cafeteria roenbergensis]|eukprot:KAA0155949.1 hypothetical protein FNF29_01368 [Cafeteria roenbergensis]